MNSNKYSSYISPNEILDNSIILNEKEFIRYYHNSIPTKYFASIDGKIYSDITKLIMKPNLTVKGYHKINLYINGKSKPKPISVHKIVATIYCSNYKPGYDVDHLDFNKINNHANNLEWVPRSVNIKRAFDKGIKVGVKGDSHPETVYSDANIINACECILSGLSIVETSKLINIPKSYLYTILRSESRKDIVSKYNFSKSIYKQLSNPLSKLIQEKIKILYMNGKSPKEIMEELNISNRTQIYNIIHRKA